MNIIISGASGFIGKQLVHHLFEQGHKISVLTRNVENAQSVFKHHIQAVYAYQADDNELIQACCKADAVINLAGENIFAKRWSTARKEAITQSRLSVTNFLVSLFKQCHTAPPCFISASAVGYYGDTGQKQVDEKAKAGDGFLAEVCKKWEAAARNELPTATRLVTPRIGIVLGKSGGMLERLLPIFKLGAGAPLGSGKQYLSWIHLNDLLAAFSYVLKTDSIAGPVNFCAPNPVSNKQFSKELAKTLNRPLWLSVPKTALKLGLGEASQAILTGQRAQPKVLNNHGFSFAFPTIEHALQDLIRNKRKEE